MRMPDNKADAYNRVLSLITSILGASHIDQAPLHKILDRTQARLFMTSYLATSIGL